MVYFVGAGSGAPDLTTVRGQRLLRKADVIIYAGSLVNRQLLKEAKPGCELHDSSCMTLEEVLAVMRRAEARGLTTVRLHTGDPCLYGAIREQMDALRESGIAFEICPGVSSYQGAAADLQCEFTLPGVSQTLILTRCPGKTAVPEKESLRSLAAHQASMVLFLSAGKEEAVVRELTAGGYPIDTPAAIAYHVGFSDEKLIRCRLDELPERVKEAGITRTALLLVGGFLGDAYERSKLYDPGFTTGFRKADQTAHLHEKGSAGGEKTH
jgi:precorrin-4/cobalt-precorrin-4 C11-methyltransferase